MQLSLGRNSLFGIVKKELDSSASTLQKSAERLSSGLRINNASDDAAGLSVATTLTATSRIYAQGIRNINDAISAVSIVDSAFESLTDIVTRITELAEQGASSTLSVSQRLSLQKEADALTSEYNRIVTTTKYNNIELFQSRFYAQGGYSTQGAVEVDTRGLTRQQGYGQYTQTGSTYTLSAPYEAQAADINRDGYIDVLLAGTTGNAAFQVLLGNGDGTLNKPVSYASNQPQSLLVGDFNEDGYTDVVTGHYTNGYLTVHLANTNGTFAYSGTFGASIGGGLVGMQTADLNGDGNLDIIGSLESTDRFAVFLGNGNGTFNNAVTYDSKGLIGYEQYFSIVDINGDSIKDLVYGDSNAGGGAGTTGSIKIMYGNSNGSFASPVTVGGTAGVPFNSVVSADFNMDGYMDIAGSGNSSLYLLYGNGNGTFAAPLTVTNLPMERLMAQDINGDGYVDLVGHWNYAANQIRYFYGNGNGTFLAQTTVSTSSRSELFETLADLNNDGILEYIQPDSNGGTLKVFSLPTTTSYTLKPVNLLTREDSSSSLTYASQTLDQLVLKRSNAGISETRLQTVMNFLSVTKENYLAASSRITEIDTAEETAKYVAAQVRQKAATSLLAQANQTASVVLQLLQ